ncbi:MAG: 50S ribosome-binding GTPase [archaeon]|nr:50S ribosome-binding GTPase [archaeon]
MFDKNASMLSQMSYKEDKNPFNFKITILGDINVGKTNIIKRLVGEEFGIVQPTVGTEFSKRTVKVQDRTLDNHIANINLQLWDTCNIFKSFNFSRSREIQIHSKFSCKKFRWNINSI